MAPISEKLCENVFQTISVLSIFGENYFFLPKFFRLRNRFFPTLCVGVVRFLSSVPPSVPPSASSSCCTRNCRAHLCSTRRSKSRIPCFCRLPAHQIVSPHLPHAPAEVQDTVFLPPPCTRNSKPTSAQRAGRSPGYRVSATLLHIK